MAPRRLIIVGRIHGAFGDALAQAAGRDPCWRKERHFSEGAAEAQMRSILRRDLAKDVKRIHVYVCPECSERYDRKVWHVGHAAKGKGRHAGPGGV